MARLRKSDILVLSGLSLCILAIAIAWHGEAAGSVRTMLSSSTSQESAVIVVGSGLAGLSAASQLIANNIPVCLLERASKPGGNSIKASSGINGAPTKYQSQPDLKFYSDTIKSAGQALKTHSEHRKHMISALTNSSSQAISWLCDDKGIDLSDVAQLGGHSQPRTHRGAGKVPPGAAIVTTLLNSLKSSPLFTMCLDSRVTEIQLSHGTVSGVKYISSGSDKVLSGPVIFATGGFAGDAKGMLAQYCPELAGFPSTNDPREGTQALLTAVGAQLVDMTLVQVHPTGFIDPKDPENPLKFLAAEVLRGVGGVLLIDGKRFVNEMETRINVTNAITGFPAVDTSPRQWNVYLVLDEGAYRAAEGHVDFYLWKGLMQKSSAGSLGSTALSTLRAYADAASGQSEDSFGRVAFGRWSLSEVTPASEMYIGRVTPVVHFTMGGVMINQEGEVLDRLGDSIPGLWAAGEVTGGIHGENRLGGSSLLECVVFGRRAGDRAAQYFTKTQS